MKYLITCLIAAALAGCEQASDSAGQADPETTAAEASIETAVSPAQSGTEPAAAIIPKAHFIRAGIYEAVREGRLVEDTTTSTGKKLSSLTMQYVKRAERIPLVKGSYMGLQYRIFGLPEQVEKQRFIEMRRVLIHPEMTLPDGSISTGSDYMIRRKVRVGQVIAHDAYGLHEDYELVEGEWTFQYWYGDHKLLEHTFTTYWPQEGEEAGEAAESTDADAGEPGA